MSLSVFQGIPVEPSMEIIQELKRIIAMPPPPPKE
jgi:hypothetical protein